MKRDAAEWAVAEFEEEKWKLRDKIILNTNFNPYWKQEIVNKSQLLDEKDSLDISDSVFSMW